jgi:BirA family biotin operon repressor/biotin-[acetyl-CoA-carboxylase] ligase
MILIKLDAIDSTNEYLKLLSRQETVENFTVVTAENQVNGRGQMGTVWNSEASKNLIMSVMISDFVTNVNVLFTINILVSVSVVQALQDFQIPELSIKWPNDIMSRNKKIAGILIENTIKYDGKINSIVGLGLNVNQTNFENLPNASSLALICGNTLNRESILLKIVDTLKLNISKWSTDSDQITVQYTENIFKKGVSMMFIDKNQNKFSGVIRSVSPLGQLEIIIQDGSVAKYDIKEIQMIY